MTVDTHDNVLVADGHNNRVQLLSPALTYLGDMVTFGFRLIQPYALHIDELNHRIYVSEHYDGRIHGGQIIDEYSGGRIYVLDVISRN